MPALTTGDTAGAAAGRSLRRSRPHYGERVIEVLLFAAALVSVATTVGILVAILIPTEEFFRAIPFTDFLTGTKWTPLFADPSYGVLPLVSATILITAIAMVVAFPLGLGAAVYLSEYAGDRTRRVLKPALEVLAGVPTVVYGFFALKAITPLLKDIWPGDGGPQIFNGLVAGIVMGIMIIPTVASLSEDAMAAVPRSLRDGAYALGSSKMLVATRVVIPAAISGIVAAFVLGVSRAIGETMIVTIAAGLQPNLTWNPLEQMETMTAFIAAAGSGDVPVGTIDYKTIFAVASMLFVMTFALNMLSIRLVRRFREVYE
jgi:phosphate transport system permease protein